MKMSVPCQRYQTCSCLPACRLQHKPRLCSMHTAGVLFSVWPNLRVTGFYLQALFVAKSPVARHLDQIISVSHPAPEIDLLCSASELEHQVKRPYNQGDPIQASEQKFRASTLHQLNCSGCGWGRDLGAHHPLRSCSPSPDEQCGANCRHVPCPPGRASSGHPCPDSTSTERVNQQQPRRAWMRDGTPGGQVHAHVHTARTPCSCRTGPSGGRDGRAGVSVLARSSMPLVWTLNHTVTVSWVNSGRQVLHTPIISGWWKVIFPCIGQSVVFICKSFSSDGIVTRTTGLAIP